MAEATVDRVLSGWGNYPVGQSAIVRPERVSSLRKLMEDAATEQTMIARGNGLAYGDAAINGGGLVASMSRLGKMLSFAPDKGLLRCQAGVTLQEILSVVVRHGWFLAVTPGTARATVGGCIACDVHGKNHHEAGSFGNHVIDVSLLCPDGEIRTCSPSVAPELFWATVGGMGLTGIVLDATIALRPIETCWVVQKNVITKDLDDTLRVLTETGSASYSVAWLDGTAEAGGIGRGVVMLGEHCPIDRLPASKRDDVLAFSASTRLGLPPGTPGLLRGRAMARVLNELIYWQYKRVDGAEKLVPASSFFYPLDGLRHWNRLYGRVGFIEYQIVVPEQSAKDLIKDMLEFLKRAGLPSFFTSMKRMGPGNAAPLSFPIEGVAFSVDIPVQDPLFPVLDRFDDRVAAASGRVYLAKDGRCRPKHIDAFYPRRRDWRDFIAARDPAGKMSSDLARRVGLRV